jgi:ring-1,2-phenylacetyl-CoA epoxidase subunit PaaE
MTFCIKNYLEAKGVAGQKIHFELFTIPGQKQSTVVHQQSSELMQGLKQKSL